MKRLSLFLLGILLVLSPVAFGQGAGSQTGTLRGTVTLADSASPLPGVMVTLESPALQGKRTLATGASGEYIFKFLPPGDYKVTSELSGMKKVVQTVEITLGTTISLQTRLEVSAQVAVVTVTAPILSEDQVAVHGATQDAETIRTLPIARTLFNIATLAPGLTTRTPNANQLQISGSFAYDNKFMVDGVDINDNLFGSATNQLVIEDAVQETQVLTSGISAEYGGFSGGIINAITKSGSNEYHGGARVDFSNDNWIGTTPYEDARGIKRAVKLNETYTGTFGGKIVQDRLWFFAAGRYLKTDVLQVLPVTAATFTQATEDYRWEAKLTGNINESHSLSATFNKSSLSVNRLSFPGSGSLQTIDASTIGNSKQPVSLFVGNYHGIFTSNLFGTAQYSEKKFGFRGNGGSDTNLETGSPFLTATFSPLQHYHAAYFDATDPEDRNNREYSASLSYFLTTGKLGSHDLKAGFNRYESIRTGGNSQSPTSYVFYADYKTNAAGLPVYDAQGRLIPIWNSDSYIANYIAFRGAENNLATNAVYVNDSWRINNNLTANIGFRYEWMKGSSSSGATITDTHTFVPRLGLAWDPKGDGAYRLSATYAQYAGKYQDSQFGQTTNVGNPNGIYSFYTGPDGEGNDFAPGFDVTHNYEIFRGSFPLANVFFQSGLSSPVTTEWTVSAGAKIGNNGNVAVTFIDRRSKDFVEDFIMFSDGKTDVVVGGVDYGTYDNIVFRNSSVPKREYQAIEFQGRYNVTRNVQTQLNYTYMIKLDGNFEGEGANTPGSSSIYGDYPELRAYDRNFPTGRLSGYQQHKLRWITNVNVPVGRFGTVNVGGIFNFDSGSVYSLSATGIPFTAIQLARDPGYANLPSTQTVYFGERGSQTFGSQSRFDLSLQYEVPVFKTVSPFVRAYVTNLFNSKQHTYNTSISALNKATDPKDANGLPTTFTYRTTFGTVTSSAQYMQPITFNLSAGIRF